MVHRAHAWAALARNLRSWAEQDPDAIRGRVDLALALAEPAAEPVLRPETRTTKRCSTPGTPRGVICSRATGTHIALLSVAAPTFFDYGERHGWDVVLSTETDLADGRPASWGKLPLIRELLDEYDLVWWIDADAIVVDGSVDIRSEVVEGKDLYLVEHIFPAPHSFAASAGIMLWRSSDWSRALLDALWGSEAFIDFHIWENGALLELLGFDQEVWHHRAPTDLMVGVQIVDCAWNSVWPDPAPVPRVNHHGGWIPFEVRRQLMLEDLARTRRGEPSQMRGVLAVDPSVPSCGPLDPATPVGQLTSADLPHLLAARRLFGDAVVVGVGAGERSARLLRTWRGGDVTTIDTRSGSDDALGAAAASRLSRFGARSSIVRVSSAQAAAGVAAGSLSYVHLGEHRTFLPDRDDVARWWATLTPGGLLTVDAGEATDPEIAALIADGTWRAARTGGPEAPVWVVERAAP